MRAVQLEAASPDEDMTDKQKRTAFSIYFNVLDLIDTLLDTTMDDITTWDQFMDTLQKHLVRRRDMEKCDSTFMNHAVNPC